MGTDHYIRAAEGWLDLGNLLEATRELESGGREADSTPEVLALRWRIAARARHWDAAYDVASKLCAAAPLNAQAWLWKAQAAGERFGGTAVHARAVLLDAQPRFPGDPRFSFELARAAAQLRMEDESRAWLDVVFRIAKETDTRREWMRLVKNDPALNDLADSCGKICQPPRNPCG